MHFNILTTCTSSTNEAAVPELNGKFMSPFASHMDMIRYWKDTMADLSDSLKVTAGQHYTGVSFRAAQTAKSKLEGLGHTASLHIMSVGYGLITADEQVFPYNLSLTNEPQNPTSSSLHRLISESLNVELWWEQMNKMHGRSGNPITDLLIKDPDAHTLVCVSGSFFAMVAGDLLHAYNSGAHNITIIGPSARQQFVKSARKLVQYDLVIGLDRDKLDAFIPGNKFDTAQRGGIFYANNFDATKSVREILAPISSDGTEQKQRSDFVRSEVVDYAQMIREAKVSGLSKEECATQLQTQGHVIAEHTLTLLWDEAYTSDIVNEDHAALALNALENIGFKAAGNDKESIELLMMFRRALIEGKLQGRLFTAKDVGTWAKNFCEMTKQPLPMRFESSQLLAYLLKEQGEPMGIYAVVKVNAGATQYQLV